MKKIVDYMKAVFAGHSADLNTTNNCSKIHLWSPTGMNPIKNQNDKFRRITIKQQT